MPKRGARVTNTHVDEDPRPRAVWPLAKEIDDDERPRSSARLYVASLTAYLIGQMLDISIFLVLRKMTGQTSLRSATAARTKATRNSP